MVVDAQPDAPYESQMHVIESLCRRRVARRIGNRSGCTVEHFHLHPAHGQAIGDPARKERGACVVALQLIGLAVHDQAKSPRITALKEVKAAGAHVDNTGAISHESHRSLRRKNNLRALLRAGRIGQDHQSPNGAPEPTVCHLKLYCAGLRTCYADLRSATVVWQSSARTPRPLMQMPVRRAKTTLARKSGRGHP